MTDANDIPLACHIAAANESEVNLIEPLLDPVGGRRGLLALDPPAVRQGG
ncbi:MAG: hypothetical protein R3C02_07120 [Planctomycetaceae bacterium]